MSKRISFFSNLIYFTVVALLVVLRIMSCFNLFDFLGGGASYIMGFVTQAGIMLALPFLMFKGLAKISVKDTLSFYGFKKVSYKTVIVSIALGAVVFFLTVYVSTFFNSVIQFFGYHPASSSGEGITTWGAFFLSIFTTAILPAICEESLHRGLYLKGISDRGITRGIIISGLLFGLLHMNIEQFFYATLIGFLLGYISCGCNSIYPCIIVHFMNNFLSVLFSFAQSKSWAFGNFIAKFAESFSNHLLGIVFFVLLLILLLVIAKELVGFLIKDSFNYNFGKKQKQLANQAIRDNYFKQIEELKSDKTSTPPLYSTQDNTIYIDFREFMEYVANSIEQIDREEQKTNPIKNIELKTKILLWGSIILSATMTILSFIWGLFR